MKSVIVRLREYEDQASQAEKAVVRYIQEHPNEAAGMSVHQMAEKTYSSASTIMRLCRKNGFKGYKEMQKSLVYELAIRKESNRWQMQEIGVKDSLEEIVNKVTYKNIASMEDTRKLVDLEILEECVNLLEKAHRVCLFGMGSSMLVAKDMYLKLLRLNKDCSTSEDWHSQLLQAKNMTEKDLAIIISYSGMTEEMESCAKVVKEQRAPLIVISRLSDSPLTKMADYNLRVAASEVVFRSGAMSSRISMLGIIDMLFAAYVNRNYDASMEQIKRTHIHKEHGDHPQ